MSLENFQKAIDKISGDIVYKSEILKTSLNQRYMIVINKVILYAVRILIEIDDRYYIHIYSHKYPNSFLGGYTFDDAIAKREKIKQYLTKTYPPNFKKLDLDVTKGVFFSVPRPYELNIIRKGDHVQILRRGVYSHTCIYIGNKKVIHIGTHRDEIQAVKKESRVLEDDWDNFYGDGGVIFIFSTIFRCRSPEKIVEKAKKSIGKYKGEYNLLWRNCQHFVTECQTGIKFITDRYKIDISNLATFWQTLKNSFSNRDSMTPFTNFKVKKNAMLHHPDLETFWHFDPKLLGK